MLDILPGTSDEDLETEDLDQEEAELNETTDESEDETTEEPEGEYLEVQGEKLPVDEVVRGYISQADYSRKTAELAQQRADAEVRTKQTVTTLEGKINELQDLLTIDKPDEELIDEDSDAYNPKLYKKQVSMFDKRKQALKDAKKELKEQQKQIDDAKAVEAGQKLYSAMTEWHGPKGEKQRAADVKVFHQHAAKLGFTQEELGKMTDHRVIMSIIQAGKLQQIKTKKPKQKIFKPKGQAPGNSSKSNAPKSVADIFYGGS